MSFKVSLLALVLVFAACPRGSRIGGASSRVLVEEMSVEVPLPDGERAQLGAEFYSSSASRSGLGILIVPGGGRVSRAGTRTGDGTRNYDAPVDVSLEWARAAAERGHVALTYDKRTCDPTVDERCVAQPKLDVDREGPAALVRDIDAACTLLEGRAQQVVIFAHGQAGQPALMSSCAERAALVVLAAPIPRDVDLVMVDALKNRQRLFEQQATRAKGDARVRLSDQAIEMKNLAGSWSSTFRSIKAGRFAKDARVHGATLDFWQSWIALTARTAELVSGKRPLVLLGEWDLQYGPDDKALIRALDDGHLFLEKADHHFLQRDALQPALVDQVMRAIEARAGVGRS